jgi:hypothetical protein
VQEGQAAECQEGNCATSAKGSERRTLGPHAWIGRSTVSVSVRAGSAREMCFAALMANDPQDEVEVTVDDEVSDELLDDVSGGSGPSTMPRR